MAAIVSAQGLTKIYKKRPAVDALDFEVAEGHVFGLLGPNGAGKTTTIRMLLGLVRPTAGGAVLLGRELGKADYHTSLAHVGAMIENPALYKGLSAQRNLEIHARYLGIDDARSRIGEVLEVVGLADRRKDKVKAYSHGMRQRLGIGVAMLGRPSLMILDEPLNGLDPAGIVETRAMIQNLPSAGTTVILSSHLLGEVQQSCDQVAIMNHGKLVTLGATNDLINKYGAGARFFVRVLSEEYQSAWQVLAGDGYQIAQRGDGAIEVVAGEGVTGRYISYALAQRGIYPEELIAARASLEEIFLQLTGESLTAQQAAGARSAASSGVTGNNHDPGTGEH